MAEEGKRVEVRMGTFACTIEGYDDPITKLKEVMSLVQHMISETPALVDVSADVDHDQIRDAMDRDVAPVRIRKDPEQDETPAPPDEGPESETDGDFILATEDAAADTVPVNQGWHGTADGDVWADASSPGPAWHDIPADAEIPDAATSDETFETDAAHVDAGPSDTADEPPASEDRDGEVTEERPDLKAPGPEAYDTGTIPAEARSFTAAPTPPARRPRPSDTRADRRLYGLGRFAAGVAGGKQPEPTTVPPIDDAPPETINETPLTPSLDDHPTPDVSAAPATATAPEDVNIFAAETHETAEAETSWSGPPEDLGRHEEAFEPRPEATETDEEKSAADTAPDTSDSDLDDADYGSHAVEDAEAPEIPDDAFEVPPEDATAATDLREPFPNAPEAPATDADLPPSEPVDDLPEDTDPEAAPVPEEPRRTGGIFRNLFGSRSRSAKGKEDGDAETEALAPDTTDTPRQPDAWTDPADLVVNEPQKPADDRDTMAPQDAVNDAPEQTSKSDVSPEEDESEPDVFNIFASAPEMTEDLPPTPDAAVEASPPAEPAPATETSDDRVDALLTRLHTARDEEETPPRMSAPGEAPEAGTVAPEEDAVALDEGVVAPEAAGVSAADYVRLSGAETVADMLAASAAWLTLSKGELRFSRRDVMEVFDGLPGEHAKTLEARIKGYGKLVRSGTLVLIGDGQFALAQSDRERFEALIT